MGFLVECYSLDRPRPRHIHSQAYLHIWRKLTIATATTVCDAASSGTISPIISIVVFLSS